MAAFQETQWRVNLEFLRATQSGQGRCIRFNHSPGTLPPQLVGRLHPGFWGSFVEDCGRLSQRHPYVQKPGAKDLCTWAACFGLGSVVGLFCINPDAGDYGVWEGEARQLVDRWAPGFAQAGCQLSLQRSRDYWLQIDITPGPPPAQPVAPPLPTAVAEWQQPGAAVGVPPAQQHVAGAPPAPPPVQDGGKPSKLESSAQV